MELREIKSIKITNSPCGTCYGKKESLELSELGKIDHNYYNYNGNKMIKNINYDVSQVDMKRFFKYALCHIKVDKWQSYNSDENIDGHRWELEITYSDDTKKNISGNTGVPPEANKLVQGILSLTSFTADPWIF